MLLILGSVLHLMYGHCQTTKYHFLCQAYWMPKYLPRKMLNNKGLMLSSDMKGYTGKWNDWDENGIKTSEGNFENGLRNGKQIEWEEFYRAEFYCSNDKLNGSYKNFNILKGDPKHLKDIYQDSYDLNKRELLWCDKKYLNNELLESTAFVDCIKMHEIYSGNLKVYEERIDLVTKQKIMELRYKNNLKHGDCFSWYNNGELESAENWAEGILVTKKTYKKNGKIVGYTREGKIEKVEIFADDLLDGESVYYHSNGKIRLTAEYKKGQLNGFVKHYDKSGVLELNERWVDNKLMLD